MTLFTSAHSPHQIPKPQPQTPSAPGLKHLVLLASNTRSSKPQTPSLPNPAFNTFGGNQIFRIALDESLIAENTANMQLLFVLSRSSAHTFLDAACKYNFIIRNCNLQSILFFFKELYYDGKLNCQQLLKG